MRILHVMRAPVGGLFRHVLDLASAQVEAGHHVGIVVDSRSGNALTQDKLSAIAPQLALGLHQVAMSRMPGLGDLSATRRVASIASVCRPDVLHGHGAKGGAYARLAGRLLGRGGARPAVVYTPHGGTLNFDPGSVSGLIFLGLERLLDPMTDAIAFESAHAAASYARLVGTCRGRHRVIHNGLSPAEFTDVSADRDAADLLFIGEMRELKGVDVLLEALADINSHRMIPVTAALVGAGPDADRFRALAADLGLDASVTFYGAMPAARAFRLGRVMVVPSRKESLPYIVLEAAAAGKALIATEVGGIPEIVAGTDTQLVAPADQSALAAAILASVAAPEVPAARAARLKAVVAERFSLARMADDVLALYREATTSTAGGVGAASKVDCAAAAPGGAA